MQAPIPVEVGEITARWLADVLDAPLRAIEIVDAHSGTTGRARVMLKHDHAHLPSSVFVKLAPFAVDQRAFVDQTGMGVAEARFYAAGTAVVPVTRVETALTHEKFK